MKAFAVGASPSRELIIEPDDTRSRGEEPERECDPLSLELPYRKLSRGFIDAVCEMLKAVMQKRFNVTSTVPMLALRLKNGADRLYLYNKDEKHYTHAVITCDFDVSATSVGFYPVLPPRYVEDKNTAFSFDYNAMQKHNKFQTKIAPAGVTLIDINKE